MPSGETVRASGVEPVGSVGDSEVLIVSVTAPFETMLTLLEPALATNSRPSLPQTSSFGWLPTLTWVRFDKFEASSRVTVSSPMLETAKVLPSGDSAAA